MLISVGREVDRATHRTEPQGLILDVTTGAVLSEPERIVPGSLSIPDWRVSGPDGTVLYSRHREPLTIPADQADLQLDDDPLSGTQIAAEEIAPGASDRFPIDTVASAAESGETLWSRPGEMPVARLAGRVLTTDGTGRLRGIRESTGALDWSLPTDALFTCPCVGAGSVIAGRTYDRTSSGTSPLIGVDVHTGRQIWELQIAESWQLSMSAGDRFFTAGEGVLTAWEVG
ncbi:PQQ-binding-like beta-propeller repeat protein [Occultella kanbiaonis]|uniref:outer membrane protein assembly factor BamB family protein n=1 Tax=Occultella kanbiaonis TaxID=2675754 RepID=UPI00143D4992|nr:PQQ-binding-like beta-propeller repeat protein [Occultella kanbiaonis]